MTLTLGSQAKTRTCVEAWKALMNTVQEGYEAREFPVAEGVVQRSYCTQSGLLAGPGCPSRATGYYKADDLPATCNYDPTKQPAGRENARFSLLHFRQQKRRPCGKNCRNCQNSIRSLAMREGGCYYISCEYSCA